MSSEISADAVCPGYESTGLLNVLEHPTWDVVKKGDCVGHSGVVVAYCPVSCDTLEDGVRSVGRIDRTPLTDAFKSAREESTVIPCWMLRGGVAPDGVKLIILPAGSASPCTSIECCGAHEGPG